VGRLIVVSNRLPVSVARKGGEMVLSSSIGGLATGLDSLSRSEEMMWVGWPGVVGEVLGKEERSALRRRLRPRRLYPVFLLRDQVENFYRGFCNKTLWPLFHYFTLYTVYEDRFWRAYVKANRLFCRAVKRLARPDDRIWVHDYHLMLLPQMLREELPEAEIGFFLHIPFPSFEVFRLLPWRTEVLHGLLGADVVGFHAYDYVRHFLSSICRIAGMEHHLGRVTVGGRLVKVDAFPMGIDYQKFSTAAERPDVRQEIEWIRRRVGDRRVIFSVDRLDYTKGIVQRLEAFDLFLSRNPDYRGKVTLVLLAVPSRTRIGHYQALRRQVEGLVGRINGERGTLDWMPVLYLYRAVPFDRLAALYQVADVALVTPLRDGMNLISKEYVASHHQDGRGVLILSEMAGAASELGEAIIVNANNTQAVARAIREALEMSPQEQARRNRLMQERLSRYTVDRWAREFWSALEEIHAVQRHTSARRLTPEVRGVLIRDYRSAGRRLLLLDYDGTLVPLEARPERAAPDRRLLGLLERLASDSANELVVLSGRDRHTLEGWLGHLGIALVAEHGGWTRRPGGHWESPFPLRSDWKQTLRPILEKYMDRTPGSAVEEKDFSLVWHYRNAEPDLARIRVHELRDTVTNLTAHLDVSVFEGQRLFEIKDASVNKGTAVEPWLQGRNWPFILALGDDHTDEDLFAVLPEEAYSIRVGFGLSRARLYVGSPPDVRRMLQDLVER